MPDSELPEAVQHVISLICSKELRVSTMKSMDIDLKKLPLGIFCIILCVFIFRRKSLAKTDKIRL